MTEPRKPKIHRSKEEKLRILQEGKKNGVVETCRKYGIYPASYYQWSQKFASMGHKGLDHGMTPDYLKEIKRLQKQIDRLKKLVADQQLESALKDELLKKKYPELRRRKS